MLLAQVAGAAVAFVAPQDGGTLLAFSAQETALPDGHQRLGLADLDGDGDLDAAMARIQVDRLKLLTLVNDGAGGYATGWSGVTFAGSWLPDADLEVADLDGDEDQDLVLNGPFGVTLRENDGDGNFSAPQEVAWSSTQIENELVDMDGDGDLDLAWYAWDLIGYLGTSRNDGGLPFTFSGELPVAPPSVLSLRAAAAHVAGDGVPDLVMASTAGLHVARGKLTSGFPGFLLPAQPLTSTGCLDVELVQLDGTGPADIVASLRGEDALGVFLGVEGGFPGAPVLHAAGRSPSVLASADFDADGAADVAAANQRGGTVSVLRGKGDGDLLFPQAFPGPLAARDLESGDADGDGRPDLLALDGFLPRLVVLIQH